MFWFRFDENVDSFSLTTCFLLLSFRLNYLLRNFACKGGAQSVNIVELFTEQSRVCFSLRNRTVKVLNNAMVS